MRGFLNIYTSRALGALSLALCLEKTRRHVHTFVKHADNVNIMSICYFIKDDVATYRKNPIAGTNMIARFAKFIVFSQLMEGMIKFSYIFVTLFSSPSLFGEFCNSLKSVFAAAFILKLAINEIRYPAPQSSY